MWKSLEERNLAIIETIMQELGVSDIEELPAKVIELKAATQLRVQSDVCPACRGDGYAIKKGKRVFCLVCNGSGKRR